MRSRFEPSALRGHPSLCRLGDDALAKLAAKLRRHYAEPAESLFRPGDPADRVYLLLAGRVRLGYYAPNRGESMLLLAGPGALFGITSLDSTTRTGSASALTECEIGSLTRRHAADLAERHPAVAAWFLQVLASRLREADSALGDLLTMSAENRVAKMLVQLTEDFGEPAGDGAVRVTHGLIQSDLSLLAGSSRETLSRLLAEFSRRGLITVEPGAFTTTNRASLDLLRQLREASSTHLSIRRAHRRHGAA